MRCFGLVEDFHLLIDFFYEERGLSDLLDLRTLELGIANDPRMDECHGQLVSSPEVLISCFSCKTGLNLWL